MIAPDPYELRRQHGGVVLSGGQSWLGPGPGHSRRDRSLSVTIAPDGKPLIYSFAGDDFRACADHLGIELGSPAPAARRSWTRLPPPPLPDPRAVQMWREARKDGEAVAAYLRSRGITLDVPPSLRQSVELVHGRMAVPTMVAAVEGSDRRVLAVQTLRLTWDARQAPVGLKRITTGKLYDGAVRLAAAGEVLGLAEGVETGLSALQLSGVPVWVSLGAERLPLVRIPAIVRELHVFADADEPGQAAAHKTARLHAQRGISIKIRTPPASFRDWNDVLLPSAADAR
jgi:putative DNA primase/helicase